MKYYSIRVVEAKNNDEADQKVMDNDFDEGDDACDSIFREDYINITGFSTNGLKFKQCKIVKQSTNA